MTKLDPATIDACVLVVVDMRDVVDTIQWRRCVNTAITRLRALASPPEPTPPAGPGDLPDCLKPMTKEQLAAFVPISDEAIADALRKGAADRERAMQPWRAPLVGLRPAREVAHDAMDAMKLPWYCDAIGGKRGFVGNGHDEQCDKLTAAIEADRRTRTP